jgi:hypothetical protein
MNKAELLELAGANFVHSPVLARAVQRYNNAASEMVVNANSLEAAARAAANRVHTPSMSPMLDTTSYLHAAIALHTAERMAFEALLDIACALEALGHEVRW